MTFFSPRAHDHGCIQFGCNAYGGLAYRTSSFDIPSTSSDHSYDAMQPDHLIPKSNTNFPRFISEHNLALYWRRPGIFPRTAGFPMPLLCTAMDARNGIRNRPPGCLRPDSAIIRYRQRNLLTGEISSTSDEHLTLWAINDLSDHKTLLQYNIEFDMKYRGDKDDQLLRFVTPGSTSRELKLSSEAMELRAMVSPNVTGKLFVRTKRSLLLANMHQPEPSSGQVFGASPQSFIQIPYMDDEIAVVDSSGFVFWGSMEQGLTRAKTQLPYREICATDNPRVLLAMSSKELRQIDLREPNTVGELLYSHIATEPETFMLPDEAYEFSGARETFCHVHNFDIELETIMLTTTRRHHLIDRRMVGKELLSMWHSEMDGGDYCMTTPSFVDPETQGKIFSFYTLTHVRRPALSHWAVMFHPIDKLWSSLGCKYELDSPQIDIPKFIASHASISSIDALKLPKYTRAIYHQALPQHKNRALLFRQMEGGEIWYENIMFNPLQKAIDNNKTPPTRNGDHVIEYEMRTMHIGQSGDSYSDSRKIPDYKLKKQAIKFIRRHLREQNNSTEALYLEGVDPKFITNPSDIIQITPINIDISPKSAWNDIPLNAEPFQGVGILEPICTEELENYNIVENVEDEDRILSFSVTEMWKKTSEQLRNFRTTGPKLAHQDTSGHKIQ